MSNLEKYVGVFSAIFEVTDEKLAQLNFQDIPEWDSVGHMGLMAELEEVFDIMLEINDIVDFSSFEKGKEILAKYDVVV